MPTIQQQVVKKKIITQKKWVVITSCAAGCGIYLDPKWKFCPICKERIDKADKIVIEDLDESDN